MPPPPGAAVRVQMSKWGDRPHWGYDAVALGSDRHGDWIGVPAGTVMARPGASFASSLDQVVLAPRSGAPGGAAWVATFYDPDGQVPQAPSYWIETVTVYVDVAAPPRWDGAVLRAVDLDLDVVRFASGDVGIDDEDEFAEHRVRFDYPPEVVALAEDACAWVHAAVLHERAPFDGDTARSWLARLSPSASPGPPAASPPRS